LDLGDALGDVLLVIVLSREAMNSAETKVRKGS
jgi:hypothetical protein